MEEDFESPHSFVKGYIVRDVCDTPSNFRSQGKLDDMLKKLGVIGICGIDTRELTKIVRESGVMNAIITDKPTLDPAVISNKRKGLTYHLTVIAWVCQRLQVARHCCGKDEAI